MGSKIILIIIRNTTNNGSKIFYTITIKNKNNTSYELSLFKYGIEHIKNKSVVTKTFGKKINVLECLRSYILNKKIRESKITVVISDNKFKCFKYNKSKLLKKNTNKFINKVNMYINKYIIVTNLSLVSDDKKCNYYEPTNPGELNYYEPTNPLENGEIVREIEEKDDEKKFSEIIL